MMACSVCVCVSLFVCVIKLCMGRFFWCMVLNNSLLDLVCSMFVCMFTRICLQGVCVCVNLVLQRALLALSTLYVRVCLYIHARPD